MSALEALQQIAAKQGDEGHPLQAIKCLEACLHLSPMPVDEAQVRLRIARLLLQHTTNLSEAKQHLQKAQLLAQKLPSHHILKCEVAALLGKAHKYCGEIDYQRGAYEKGLDVCSKALSGAGGADSATKAQLQRWACYFHLRTADALASQADSQGAGAAVERGLEVAQKYGLLVDELVLRMFQLQLAMVAWDRAAAEAVIQAAGEALRGAGDQGQAPALLQAKLHFNTLQIIYSIRLGQFDQLVKPPDGADAAAPPAAIQTLEELLAALKAAGGGGRSSGGGGVQYEWLPFEAQEALCHLLASVILRAPGKTKPALAHVVKGVDAVDAALQRLGIAGNGGGGGSGGSAAGGRGGGGGSGGGGGAALGEQQVDHTHVWVVRTLVVMRILLLEARMQLHLLQSNFAAARADVAANISLHGRFPVLLEALRPSLHMQAALYAHAVGAWGAALRHYALAADAGAGDPLVEPQARCLAALARLAQGGPDAVGEAVTVMGDLYQSGADQGAGYAERVLAQAAGALLRLAAPSDDPQQAAQAAEAKVLLGKALKTAHNRLHNHQLVTQLLNSMAPLRLDASDLAGAAQMLTSSFTLAKGMGDLNGQVAALSVLQQVYSSTHQADQAAHNSNYLARKKAELAERLAKADADAAEHAAVLGWGL